MSLARLQDAFAKDRHHVSAFLMLGDPTPEISVELAIDAVDAGVTMLELGIPFSDPCADGPAIEASCRRALAAGVSTGVATEVLAAIHARRPEVPLNLLVYGNLVHAPGEAAFCAAVGAAGASSLLVPDMPLEEAGALRQACAQSGLGHVSLVGPRTDADRLQRVAAASSGFLYLAGYQGVTGGPRADVESQVAELLRRTVAAVDLPVCLGFGIQSAAQIESAFAAGARVAVVGSYLARAIATAWPAVDGAAATASETGDPAAVRAAFGQALRPLLQSLPTS